MPAPVGHEEFFNSLTTLLTNTSQKTRGSVYLTQTPLLNNSSSETQPATQTPSILIRASDGNTNAPNPKTQGDLKKQDKKKQKESKVKISTVVQPADLEAFYARYAEVCKAGMTGLKKRDRKLKKAKAKGGAGKVTKA
ncbi:signal recognition particle 14 kDa protein [Aspergillus stella-maris]|uniref:signal recognition particle 14 kDa protein n=1 Tax=Aspergillus stella-maris TaxID=1810926 RepID=UPI003CCCC50E